LEALINQVRQRLEFLRIGPGDNSAVFHAAKPVAKKARPIAAAKPAPGAESAAPTPAVAGNRAPKPVETLYRMEFLDAVRLIQAGRALDADKLELWARTMGGKLPDGAIAQVRAQNAAAAAARTAPSTESPDTAPAPPVSTAPAVAARTPEIAPTEQDRSITLHWTGPCVVNPLEETPPELTKEHLAARFTAEQAGAVRLSETQRSGTGRAGAIDYGATSGTLLLTGAGPTRPRLEVADAGAIETDRIEGNLATGIVHAPGAGVLTRSGRDSSITWNEQADFTFRVIDGAVSGELAQAVFSGGVLAADRNATLRGEFARADFISAPGVTNAISRLVLKDHTSASRGNQRLAADTLDAEFAPPTPGAKAGDPDLRVVTLSGHAAAQRDDAELNAESIEASLARNAKGDLDVVGATAHGGVRFSRERDRIHAIADQMRADLGFEAGTDARRQIIDLVGEGTRISQGEIGSVTGTQMRLDGIAQSIAVFGPGAFDYTNPGKAVIHSTWADGMTFSDLSGELECWGSADAVSTPNGLSRDHLEAERLKLSLTPREKGGASSEGKERRLLKADAIGSVLEREGGVNARFTSERFTADAGAPEGRRRGQLLYLEGPILKADNEKETLDVPAPGKLMIVDRRGPDVAPAPPPMSTPSLGGAKGDSLFSWLGTFHLERASGRAEMDRGVHLTHRSVNDREITNMDCDHLVAVARATSPTPPGDGGAGAAAGSLESVTATGAIYVTSGTEVLKGQPRPLRRELVADRAEYDAVKRTLQAGAAPGNLVSYFDPAKGAPVSADGLFWDVANGRVDLTNPRPVVVPRQ
jgi:hypothetical protein